MKQPKVRGFSQTLTLSLKEEAESTVDTAALAQIVQDTFLLSMDARVPEAIQGTLNAHAITLRLQLRELLGAVFQAGIAELVAASATIKKVNADLKAAKASIDKVASTIEGLGKLVGQLNQLLKIIGVVL